MEGLVFTPAAVLALLSQIDEISELDVGVTETLDGNLQIQVGESVYVLSDESATDISVEPDILEAVESINVEAYEELADNGQIEIQEPIESGILSQIGKTLAVGGLVRLASKLLR